MDFLFYEGKSCFSSIYDIRKAVFVEEQGFDINSEFDDIDERAIHLLATDNGIPIGTARLFFDEEEVCHFGRICILKEYRGKNIGRDMLFALEEKAKQLGAKRIVLGAQVTASEFYEKQGFTKFGRIYMDEFCPHIMMGKEVRKG